MNTEFAVIIGRWQILQKGHLGLLSAALSLAPRAIVVIGSAWRARIRTIPSPAAERQQQFEAALTPEEQRARELPARARLLR